MPHSEWLIQVAAQCVDCGLIGDCRDAACGRKMVFHGRAMKEFFGWAGLDC